MLIDITVESFRNLVGQTIRFAPGINLFHGPNGAGKTNLLEAIGLFALSKSCRGASDSEMVAFERELAEIKGNISDIKKK